MSENKPGSAEIGAGLIHMTSTYQTPRGDFGVRCRCPWAAEGFASLVTARNAGDAHLREANATCPTTPGDQPAKTCSMCGVDPCGYDDPDLCSYARITRVTPPGASRRRS